jgi:peptide deformylase
MSYQILKNGDKTLNRKSKKVSKIDDSIRNFCKTMVDTMYENNGVGLSAPQIGLLKRIISIHTNEKPLVLINPEIVEFGIDKVVINEGCLSFPGEFYNIERPEEIKVKYRDLSGKPCLQVFKGLTSRIIQHEIDHLDGKLFVEHVK